MAKKSLKDHVRHVVSDASIKSNIKGEIKEKIDQNIVFKIIAIQPRNTYQVNLDIKIESTHTNSTLLIEYDLKENGIFNSKQSLDNTDMKLSNYLTNMDFGNPIKKKIGIRIGDGKGRYSQQYVSIDIPLKDPEFSGNIISKAIREPKAAFSWKPVEYAEGYQVQISKDRNFSKILIETTLAENYYTLTNDIEVDVYYCVRVKPLSSKHNTRYAPFFGFAYIDIPMISIPGATYEMGKPYEKRGTKDEEPIHTVTIDPFKIDQYEVNNKYYALFLNCQNSGKYYRNDMANPKTCGIIYTNNSYIVVSGRDFFPIVYVKYSDGLAFAEWRNMSLPTEAQWEYAAKGTNYIDYPFGDDWIDKAPFGINKSNSVEVNSFVEGKSFFGLYHVSGNVWEWMFDWYDRYYYRKSNNSVNPRGPDRGETRVMRSGSFGYENFKSRVTYRDHDYPHNFSAHLGFRCATLNNE